MDNKNLNSKPNSLYNKININGKRPFKDIKFSLNQNNIFSKDRNFHNKYLIKIKEKNKLKNNTLYEKSSLGNNKIDNKKVNILKIDTNENKENQIKLNYHKFTFNKIKKIRCSSQAQCRNTKIVSSPPKNDLKNDEDDGNCCDNNDLDINLFFDKINKEFDDIGKLIKITFIVDEKRKYDFVKNEYILLKIIENELKEKYGFKIKEFFYKEQKLNVFKSLKDNKLENNCLIKVVLE